MTDTLDIVASRRSSASGRVVELIRSRIVSQQLRPGDRLPPISELSKNTGYSYYSINKAIKVLQKEGLVEAAPSRGTFITDVAEQVANGKDHENGAATEIGMIYIANAFANWPEDCSLSHPDTSKGILLEGEKAQVHVSLVEPYMDWARFEEYVHMQRTRSGENVGVIWLYPNRSQWPHVEAFVQQDIPLVVTSHGELIQGVTCVQSGEVDVGRAIAEHFCSHDCKQVVYFQENLPELGPLGYQFASGAQKGVGIHMGLMSRLNQNCPVIEMDCIRFNYGTEEHRRYLVETLTALPAGTGVVLRNTPFFHQILAEHHNEIIAALRRVVLVVETVEYENNALAPLVDEGVRIHTFTAPLKEVGCAAVQKVLTLGQGRLQHTNTLVPVRFGPFQQV